jgi:iron-sulfur cluster assembly 2
MPPRCVNAPSAARLFVQLSASSHQGSLLDVFLPRQTRTFRSARTDRARRTAIQDHVAGRLLGPALSRRGFSGTSYRRMTKAIHNPQVDEDGKEMMLEITPRAAQVTSTPRMPQSNKLLTIFIRTAPHEDHGKG